MLGKKVSELLLKGWNVLAIVPALHRLCKCRDLASVESTNAKLQIDDSCVLLIEIAGFRDAREPLWLIVGLEMLEILLENSLDSRKLSRGSIVGIGLALSLKASLHLSLSLACSGLRGTAWRHIENGYAKG